MVELELKDIDRKVHRYLLVLWSLLFILTVLALFTVVGGIFYPSLKIPVNSQFILDYKNSVFILFAMLIICIFLVKRTWLSANLIFAMVESEADLKKTWGIPLTPFIGELHFGNGVYYHIRKTYALVYLILFLAIIVIMVYYFMSGDRYNLYMYLIITLFSLTLNYPRNGILIKLKYLLEEENNHD